MTIEKRLEKLEKELKRRNRLNRYLFIALVVLALFWGLMGTSNYVNAERSDNVIRAERFELVDADGNIRASLAIINGDPGLGFVGKNGVPRAGLILEDDKPSLDFFDNTGNLLAGYRVSRGFFGTAQEDAASKAKDDEISREKDRLPGGQARMAPQTDPHRVGRTRIPEDLHYPGMEKFDDKAAIDFISSDSQDVVAQWFEQTHNAQTTKRNLQSGYKWEITVEDYTIEVFPYENDGAHIRYKRKIK